MERQALSVTELNNRIKGLLDLDPMLADVCVRGELSNYKIYPSGHHYFTLKDSESSLRCVMFKGSAAKLRFRPESGMSVTAFGRVSVYPRDGAYQLYCSALQPEGAGDLQVAFEQLKAKLAAEGLFDRSHKKPLPAFPEKIAIVTSSAGAAVHDMIRILGHRWPMTKVVLLPVRVQGVEAPPEIAGAIRYANEFPLIRCYLALALCGCVCENSLVAAVGRLVKFLAVTVMSAVTAGFCLYVGVTGLVAGSTDAAAVKAARTVIAGVLPVVGGILSDSAASLIMGKAVV